MKQTVWTQNGTTREKTNGKTPNQITTQSPEPRWEGNTRPQQTVNKQHEETQTPPPPPLGSTPNAGPYARHPAPRTYENHSGDRTLETRLMPTP